MAEEPAFKRAKLSATEGEYQARWESNLEQVQSKLLKGCMCEVETVNLLRSGSAAPGPQQFSTEYILQVISTLEILASTALHQQSIGFICPKILKVAADVSADEFVWELLLESSDSPDKFTAWAASKALTFLLLWAKLPNIQTIIDDLFIQIMAENSEPVPQRLNCLMETIRGVVTYKESDHHPLEGGSEVDAQRICKRVEIDEDLESEDKSVKSLCVKALLQWWPKLLTKFHQLLSNYEDQYEYSIITFFSLWQSIVCSKNNVNYLDSKHFHMHLQAFVSHLNATIPAIIWKKILDLFAEILCYGSTLSLQDCLADEPYELAHLILRCVKSRPFLQGVPYNKKYTGFGGTTVADVDWEWKSSMSLMTSQTKSSMLSFNRSLTNDAMPGPSWRAHLSSGFNRDGARSSKPGSTSTKPRLPELSECSTFFVGPSDEACRLEESYTGGDRTLLQKLVLVVFKSVALTVKETRDDDCDSDESDCESEADTADMPIIEKSIREVFQQLDAFIKSLLPYHPAAPIGEWVVKLFGDQDDALVEAMLCALDTYTGFHGQVPSMEYLDSTINPIVTFNSFAAAVSHDKEILLELLMGNETCFLLYFLRYLKFGWKNWQHFVSSCGRDFEKVMDMFIKLRISVLRMVEKSLFPYNINPVLRLLEKFEDMYEKSGELK